MGRGGVRDGLDGRGGEPPPYHIREHVMSGEGRGGEGREGSDGRTDGRTDGQ